MNLDKKSIKKILLMIAFAIVLYTALQNLQVVLKFAGFLLWLFNPFILGLCVAFILNVPLRFIETKVMNRIGKKNTIWLRCRRPVSILLTIGFVVSIMLALILLIMPEVAKTVRLVGDSLPGYLDSMMVWAEKTLERFDISQDALKQIQINWESIEGTVTNFLKEGGMNIFNTTINFTAGIFSGIFNFVMSIIFAIYILMQKEKLYHQADSIMTAFMPGRVRDKVMEIGALSNRIFSGFVSGQVAEAVIIGILCFIGMKIFAIPYAPMISALVGFTALIPVFGAFIGTGVGAFLILMVSPVKAVWFVLFIIILQQLEGDIIYPKVVGKSVGLPSLWVMLAVLIGGNLYGAVGMLISVPLCSVMYSVLRSIVKERLKEKAPAAVPVSEDKI